MKCIYIVLSIQFLFSSNSFSHCGEFYLEKNKNTVIHVADYRQPNYRAILDYQTHLGNPFQTAFLELKRGDTFIDSGAGFGLAGFEAYLRKSVYAYAVNTQNLWQQLHEASEMLNMKLQSRVNSIAARSVPNWDAEFDEYTTSQVEKLIKVKKIQYRVGFSEVEVPKIERKANLLTDVYGAFYYSVNRLHLLNVYFNQLDQNGNAFVLVGRVSNENKRYISIDQVQDEKKQVLFLTELLKRNKKTLKMYIVEEFGNSVEKEFSSYEEVDKFLKKKNSLGFYEVILKMHKNKSDEKLDAPFTLDESSSVEFSDLPIGSFPTNVRYLKK